MRIPFRYTYATWSVTLATTNKGPSGARSGSQTYSPVFSVTVSGDTRTPSVKVSARMSARSRTSSPEAKAINNKNFIVANPMVNSFSCDDFERVCSSQCLFDGMYSCLGLIPNRTSRAALSPHSREKTVPNQDDIGRPLGMLRDYPLLSVDAIDQRCPTG